MLKAQEKITLIQLYKHASEELKVRLLQFLNNIYIYIYTQKILSHINGDMPL